METVKKTLPKGMTPWKKGQCPNPNGRPNGQRNYITIYREALRKIGETKGMTPEQIEELMEQVGLEKALKGDFNFQRDIKDRIHGKAPLAPDGLGSAENPIHVQHNVNWN